jgi:hypothetical protein
LGPGELQLWGANLGIASSHALPPTEGCQRDRTVLTPSMLASPASRQRRGWDLNPRTTCMVTSLAGRRVRPDSATSPVARSMVSARIDLREPPVHIGHRSHAGTGGARRTEPRPRSWARSPSSTIRWSRWTAHPSGGGGRRRVGAARTTRRRAVLLAARAPPRWAAAALRRADRGWRGASATPRSASRRPAATRTTGVPE